MAAVSPRFSGLPDFLQEIAVSKNSQKVVGAPGFQRLRSNAPKEEQEKEQEAVVVPKKATTAKSSS
jgi:hypothetical protein